MKLEVMFSPEAEDLKELYVFIAQRSGVMRVIAYIERIEDFVTACLTSRTEDRVATISLLDFA